MYCLHLSYPLPMAPYAYDVMTNDCLPSLVAVSSVRFFSVYLLNINESDPSERIRYRTSLDSGQGFI